MATAKTGLNFDKVAGKPFWMQV